MDSIFGLVLGASSTILPPMFGRQIRRLLDNFGATHIGWLRRLSGAQRRALACTLLSLVPWSLWNGLREFDHPWGDISAGLYSDHFSHMNAARIFPRIGLDIWRKPITEQFTRLTYDEMASMPRDIRAGVNLAGGYYRVPDWPEYKPLAIGWSQKPRMYPPGDMLLVAPVALLYHYTNLSLSGACRLLFGLFIITAHAALFFFFLTYFEHRGSALDWLVCFLVYSTVMRWTLDGFYDAVAIVPLCVCGRYLARNKGLAAVVAFCVAACLHFRAFFQAPWAIWGAWLMIRGRFWRNLQIRHVVALLVALLCAVAALYPFSLVWESFDTVLINNPIRYLSIFENKPMTWNFKIVVLVCLGTLVLYRAWFDVATLAWLSLVAFSLREFYGWHMLVATSWFTVPSKREAPRAVRVAFLVSLIAVVFRDGFTPHWLWMLYHADSP